MSKITDQEGTEYELADGVKIVTGKEKSPTTLLDLLFQFENYCKGLESYKHQLNFSDMQDSIYQLGMEVIERCDPGSKIRDVRTSYWGNTVRKEWHKAVYGGSDE